MSDAKQPAENWSAESKLAIIIETGSLSELEIGEYCRRKGIFPEQITDWRNFYRRQHETVNRENCKLRTVTG